MSVSSDAVPSSKLIPLQASLPGASSAIAMTNRTQPLDARSGDGLDRAIEPAVEACGAQLTRFKTCAN